MMKLPNAYCKKHDEIEPQNNTDFWTCPKCSNEKMKIYLKKDEKGKTALDLALDLLIKNYKK